MPLHFVWRMLARRLRFSYPFLLWLHDFGELEATPNKIVAGDSDWRFLDELKREPEAWVTLPENVGLWLSPALQGLIKTNDPRRAQPPSPASLARYRWMIASNPLVPLVDGILIDPGRVVARAAGRMTKNRKLAIHDRQVPLYLRGWVS
jgi:hypothetical protein